MSESRLTQRVGLFVATCLLLLAVLLLSFSKGLKWLTPAYGLRLRAASVGGLQKRSSVLMSGVPVGFVVGADIDPTTHGVIIYLKIQQKYQIPANARFAIEQIGFLGDQYVAIYPRTAGGVVLQPGAEVTCEEPLSIQEVVRTTSSLMQQMDHTVTNLQQAIERMNRTILSERTLTNLETAFDNVRELSGRTLALTDHLDRFLKTNTAPASAAVSNVVRFTENMDKLAVEVRQTLADNRSEISVVLTNLASTTRRLDGLAKDLEAGKGLAGALLQDEQLKAQILNAAGSLANLSSNLNRFGLLYKPKPPKRTPAVQYPGKKPID